jgi:ribosomal protein L11 methyltransferase
MDLAPAIGPATARGGTVILSGLLERQSLGVVAAYTGVGLLLRQKIIKRDWATLILERP